MQPPSFPVPMNATSKTNKNAARDDLATQKELASAVRPVRFLLAASILLPIAIFALASWVSYQQHLSEAQDRVQRNLNTIYEHALKVFETFELSSRYLDELAGYQSDAEIRKSESDFSARLKSITDKLPQLRDLWVISAAGTPLASATIQPIPKLDLSDRDYFRVHRDNPNAGTYVSEVLKARAADTTFFTLSRRRSGPKNSFAGVTTVSIAPEYFVKFYAKLPPPGVFALIRDDGAILARYPDISMQLDKLAPDSAVMRSIAEQPGEGLVSGASSFDDHSRLLAYRKMPNYNIYVVSGIPGEVIIQGWLKSMASHLVFGLPATVAMIGLGLIALRRTRREAFAYTKLRQEVVRRERTELALQQSQKMEAVGRLTGGIAHDFNNLLTAILGNVDLALRRLGDGDERLKRSLNSARQASERAASLVQRLLAFSRQHPLEVRAVDVNKLVQGMSELLRRTIGETITVESVLAGGLWKTAVDPNQLENALLNLAVNARDAMPGGGRLTIETANTYLDDAYVTANASDVSSGQYILIAISDTGGGMSKEVIERAFEPFFTTKPSGSGTGLGLSMVYGFVKQSGGHIKIYSEAGEGTAIKLYLPRLMDENQVEPWVPTEPAAERKNGADDRPDQILLVEDDEEVNHFSSEVLREDGYHVISTHDAAAGLRLLDANPDIKLLFTDVVLPGGMNGRQLADEALRRRPNLRVLFTTGYTRNAIIHHGRLDADVDLLTKPFTSEALAKKVRQILDLDAKDPITRVSAIIDSIKDKPANDSDT
ncbi:ATP-binding protein [Pseudorhodoplanes sinuspersici]|nr:ATP-binding protein [Pseudorhodoplanes sinuspersici]